MFSKKKEGINKALKNSYPLFIELIDKLYKDKDFQTEDYCEVTGKTSYLTAEQYKFKMLEVLEEKMTPIRNTLSFLRDIRLYMGLSQEPCGVWGDG